MEKGRYGSIKRLALVENREYLNLPDKEGRTALMIACQAKNKAIVDYLCHQGAKLHLRDNKGRTALMLTCILGSPEIMKILLDCGAEIDIEDNEGRNALTMVKQHKQQH